MNKCILNTEIQHFINNYLDSDVSDILLKGTAFKSVSTKEIVEQIEAKNKCKKKLPSWFSTSNIYYPNKLNIEQTSSEVTSKYKSERINGESILDLTGGFGVDSFYFAKRFKQVVHCEIDPRLSEIVSHNFKVFKIDSIDFHNGNGLDFLETSKNQFNWIYIDPSRRHDSKGKVFFLKDCLPNVPSNLDLLFQYSKNIMVKTSPLLDLSVGIDELRHVKTIYIVALNNEVKELLWILEDGFSGSISIETVNLKDDASEYFKFLMEDEKSAVSEYCEPLNYLYEPNAAILKSGGFHIISSQLPVFKLHQHSHLYTSKKLINFPGRCFKIENSILYNKRALKSLGITKANITTRNFPETVQHIRNKFNIKDGGDYYLFFTTNVDDKKIIILCKKEYI